MKKNEILKELTHPITKNYLNSGKYLNRELSWLEFNKRVLYQALRKDVPICERLNFLSITSSNIDEFIMVRLSAIMNRMVRDGDAEITGMKPDFEYQEVLKGIKNYKDLQNECASVLAKKLESLGKHIVKFKELNKAEKGYVSRIFYNEIFPLLTPLNFDTTKSFPELVAKQLTIVVSLEDSINNNLQVISFIPLDDSLPRAYKIPSKDGDKYIFLEELIYGYLPRIYFNKKIIDYGTMKVLREADIELSHNTDVYIVDRMRKTLLDRRFGEVVFIDVTDNVSKDLQKIISKIFNIKKSHVYEHDFSINYNAFKEIDIKGESYKKFTPQYPQELLGEHDMFSAIDSGDILLSHPFESYDPVVKFLEHAAYDKDVLAIKQTLYRVSSTDSPIVNALCHAAENGKQVTVILEIKARFDEDRNLSLIEKFKNAGVKLVYGTEELKTHCKFIVVVRRSRKGIKIYTHVGTGNYNDKTATLYTDISLFTSNFKFGSDIVSIFNMLSGFAEPSKHINHVYFSPYSLRDRLIHCIDREIKSAKKGNPGIIIIKVNSISDKKIIDKLYEASRNGVNVMIFCRGICSMRPINDRIIIKSLVGRFLEHSRIYYFNNSKREDVYISSADLLTRNLDKRYELLVPVKDDGTKEKLMKILSMYYKDEFNTFQMDKEGVWHKVKGDTDIHELFMKEAIENYKLKSIPKFHK